MRTLVALLLFFGVFFVAVHPDVELDETVVSLRSNASATVDVQKPLPVVVATLDAKPNSDLAFDSSLLRVNQSAVLASSQPSVLTLACVLLI